MGSVEGRAIFFIGLIIASLVVITPTFTEVPPWWPWKAPMRLGLDLQGGTHLLYQVEIDQAIDNTVERISRDIERELRDANVGAFTVDRTGRTLNIKLANRDKRGEVRRLLEDRFTNLSLSESSGSDAADLTLELKPAEVLRIRQGAVEQALDIMRNRIDQFGVAEPTLQAQGDDQIVVQLPGIQDPGRAKELIGRTALLEFRLLAEGPQAGTIQAPGAGVVVMPGQGDAGGRTQYLVEKRPIMTGEVITDARVQPGSATEGMAVDFVLDARGAKLFGDATTEHVKRRLAIVLDGYVQSAPEIREPITGGRGQITGRFNFTEAQDLANVLRNGALPAPLKLLEERTVGPSLGKDSIRQGSLSFLVGSLAVVAFMIFYYRGGGIIADLALIMNVLLLLGAFAAFGFTLTMPGIAGIVLTVGMAVDANVLILERVREELRLGKSARASIEAGYDRAWSAILDSNVTTFLSGLILFQFGSGPIRGFAVTLCLGILTTIASAVFATRVVYDWRASRRRLLTVSV
ncbi:MAG TPA: protein translocase subunit SecD [Candidatus Binatia bacterium]|jgi:preprotein translocase subunit SecD|nr:protein translocase subunit SecD [Candidatus Binatia bacterium]